MGRPKGSKNRSTILREAQETRHFYLRATAAKQTKQPDEVIDAAMIQAVQIAEKIAPYRHARLSAAKLAGDPNNPARFKDASIEELRAEVMKADPQSAQFKSTYLTPIGTGTV
jgi:hypothetical protein